MARLRTPGSTTAVPPAGSMRLIRLSLDSPSSTPCACGMAPPDRPVPAPRATIGTFMRLHSCMMARTCASSSGRATTAGSARYSDRPSHSYGRVSSSRCSTQCAGSIDSKASISG
ncbi:Uncharacterised protein [Bordetella pertussis]|nr:Uncharacterised protein [Bordetella pertussis]CFW08544.1 Uncharacterised protein [Bordetella pertussis]